MDYQTDSGELVNFFISQYIYVSHDQILTDEVHFVVYIWGPFREAIQSIFVQKEQQKHEKQEVQITWGQRSNHCLYYCFSLVNKK